jgi:DNA-directed RNA polymerase specialized sigma24 family protein
MWPPDDVLFDAWRLLVADPDTAGPFVGFVFPPLERDLARQFPREHPDDVTAAVDVAVVAFLKNPTAYDPARSSLPGFLRMIARRRLAHARAAEGRHRRRRFPWDCVELDYPARNEEEERPALADFPEFRAVIDSFDETDRRVYELWRDGEQATAVFAVALGIADWPSDEQAAEVKRAKDRILARLKRAAR